MRKEEGWGGTAAPALFYAQHAGPLEYVSSEVVSAAGPPAQSPRTSTRGVSAQLVTYAGKRIFHQVEDDDSIRWRISCRV